jgi:hypothetical protein
LKSLIDTIKEVTLSPRNDKALHFSQHLTHNRHTALYWWYGYPTNTDQPWANTLPLLQGNAIHNELHSIMSEHHKPYVSERLIVPDEDFAYPWRGTADAYTENDKGEVCLIDYKTISGAGMTFLDEPKYEHLLQVSCYHHFDTVHSSHIYIMYLPTSMDYARKWHEPQILKVDPVSKEELISIIRGVESDISIYQSTRMLPDWPEGNYIWKENKRNKNWELSYRPHYTTMYCPWRVLGEDDPCGCSGDKPVKIGTWSPKDNKIVGDEDTIRAYLINNPDYNKENK